MTIFFHASTSRRVGSTSMSGGSLIFSSAHPDFLDRSRIVEVKMLEPNQEGVVVRCERATHGEAQEANECPGFLIREAGRRGRPIA
jgi:hypothetical protein